MVHNIAATEIFSNMEAKSIKSNLLNSLGLLLLVNIELTLKVFGKACSKKYKLSKWNAKENDCRVNTS